MLVYKAGHGPTDFLICVSTTERRMKNNDHQRLLAMYIDWLTISVIIAVLISLFFDEVRFFLAGKYEDRRLQNKERINVLFAII